MNTQLRLGSFLNTAELADVTAGGDNYIRTKDKKVLGLAYNPTHNRYAPTKPGVIGLIVFGTGPQRTGRAELFLSSKAAVPVFVKRKKNVWEYIGEYKAEKISRDPAEIKKYCGNRDIQTQAGVLHIRPSEDTDIEVSGGGFPDPETRKAVEQAAIAFATQKLREQGFLVKSHEDKKLGYDLYALGSDILLVEVKGTNCLEPRFFLTRIEFNLSKKDANWRLFVVCNALVNPTLQKYTAKEMSEQFGFDPLAWECTKKG